MSQKLEKMKTHLRENKKVYIAATVGVAVGAVGGAAVVFVRSRGGATVTVDSWKMIEFKWKSPTNNITQIILSALGDPGNVVQCDETGTIYASQGQAARELGATASEVSRHCLGKLENIKGLHLKVLGKAGEPIAG